MATAMFSPGLMFFDAGVAAYPDARGVMSIVNMNVLERQTFPTDPVGNMSLTLQNLVVGSIYDIEVFSTGAQIVSGTASAATVPMTVPVYLSGDPKNSLRIKVRKASGSPYYQPYETQAVAAVGAQSIFINQLSDE